MSKIVISGYYGFANAGDEAMLTAIIKSLRQADKNVQLTVISGNPHITAAKHGVRSVHRFSLFSIISEIKSCDLLLSGGGSLLQDVTSQKSLLYYLTVLTCGWLLGKKVMLFAQGIGPIRSTFLRRLTRFVCSRADLITVRDIDSLAEIEKIGIDKSKAALTADAVLTLPQPDRNCGRKILKRFSVPEDRPLLAVSVRKWGGDEGYLREIADAARKIALDRNAFVLILPLQYSIDTGVCTRLQQYLVGVPSAVINYPCDTEEFLSIIGGCFLLMGMRLHALIFASVMQVPFVALSYDPKIDGFVKEVEGANAGKVEALTGADVLKAADEALEQSAGCWVRLKDLRVKAMQNISMAFALLNNRQKI